MATIAIFVLASLLEIGGCFAFWAVVRQGASPIWLTVALASLVGFAWALTQVDVDFAGRAYAIYGGVYIASSLVWLWVVEGRVPDRWDAIGAAVCLCGAAIILFAPRHI